MSVVRLGPGKKVEATLMTGTDVDWGKCPRGGNHDWYRCSRIVGNAKEHAPFPVPVEQRIYICNKVPGKTESRIRVQ
jgi:hypothetical protein